MGITLHMLNGSPVYPGTQLHEGAWFRTLHSALSPHVPGHGSLHLLFAHAFVRSQSAFVTHSGLHPVYGSPKYSGRQTQEPAPFFSRQIALAPHGDGLHGSLGPSVGGTITNINHDELLK